MRVDARLDRLDVRLARAAGQQPPALQHDAILGEVSIVFALVSITSVEIGIDADMLEIAIAAEAQEGWLALGALIVGQIAGGVAGGAPPAP